MKKKYNPTWKARKLTRCQEEATSNPRFLQQMGRNAGDEQVSRSAIGVVAGAGTVGVDQVEMPAEPLGGRIGVADGVCIVVEERFIDGKPIISEGQQADDQIYGQ